MCWDRACFNCCTTCFLAVQRAPPSIMVRPAISGGGDRPGLRRTNCSHLFSYQQTIRLPAAAIILIRLEGLITTDSSSRGEDASSWTSTLSFLHSLGFSAIRCLFPKKSHCEWHGSNAEISGSGGSEFFPGWLCNYVVILWLKKWGISFFWPWISSHVECY